MEMFDPDDRWYFAKDRLNESPSRRHGYDSDKELSCRQQAANFIQDMGQKLQVSQLCINTAIVYMHRFYVFHSLVQFHRNAIATAALFLAAKVEEQPRKVEHVLKVAHLCLHRETPSSLDTKSELYQEQSNDLVVNESILLQTLGFDVAIDHPHTHVVRCCQLVKASKDLAQTSYFMASNSLHLTTMCLQYKPTVVACFCIHLACKWSNWEIPRSSEGKDWFWYVNQSVTLDLLEQLTSEFLLIFDKCPTKLKRKMMSMNQNNPPVHFGPASGPQESYHFDEPRKLMGAEANRVPESFLQMQKSVEKSQMAAANAANASNAAAAAIPPPRHIDYKEYKEKKERERQEKNRMHRKNLKNPSEEEERKEKPPKPRELVKNPYEPHGFMPKTPEQTKPLYFQLQQQQQQPRQPPGVSAHKMYPQHAQQPRPHPSNPSAVPHAHRPPIKEVTKRKFEEVDNGSHPDPQFIQDQNNPKIHPRNSEDFRHKNYPNNSFPGQEQSHTQSKDLTTGIRDIITQSFGPREKPHRPNVEERPYPNYPYQRASGSSRPPQPPVITKMQREEVKKSEEMKQDDAGHGKHGNSAHPSLGHITGPHSSHSAHGMERYNQAKSQMMQQQQKQRDPKFKGHHVPQKEPSQKHPANVMQSNSAIQQPSKKPPEKPVEKRKYHEQPSMVERGLPASMESLLPQEDMQRGRGIEQKRTPQPNDAQKKEKPPQTSKYSEKPIAAPLAVGPIKFPEEPLPLSFEVKHPVPQGRPHKFPRLDERIKMFEPEPNKQVMGITGEQVQKPAKTSSIFSPDNNVSPKHILSSFDKEARKSDIHFSGPPAKKPHSSLFSPPSTPTLPNLVGHRPSGDLILPASLSASGKPERESLPLLDDRPLDHKSFKEKHQKPEGFGVIVGSASSVTSNVTSSSHSSSHHGTPSSRIPSGSRHLNTMDAFATSEKSKVAHNYPSHAATIEPKVISSPVSTVNLLGMEKMVDTSIAPVMPVIKPVSAPRPEAVKTVTISEPEKKLEEKPKLPVTDQPDLLKKAEKKKKDKDREKDSHRHKEKKKSDGKKEKKKHKEKDKERKKDSHRDKHREKPKEVQEVIPPVGGSHLKITIPKDKIGLSAAEGTGLKLKIAKDRLKPEEAEPPKPEIGGLKIKIKKDSFTHFKEEPKVSKKRESGSHSSHHKSSKPPKPGEPANVHRSSKKESGSKSSSSK